MQSCMELDMKKNSVLKDLTVGIWSLKTSRAIWAQSLWQRTYWAISQEP